MTIDINLSVEKTIAAIEAELRAEELINDEPEPPPRCEWCGTVEKYPGQIWSGGGEVIDGEYCEECWGAVLDLDYQLAREAQEERDRRSKK